jgi:hypothetical protein
MTRFSRQGMFPNRYVHSPDGLAQAEIELERLVERHAAYAAQPDITRLWQGYVDQKAALVADQEVLVTRLRTDLSGI